MLNVDTVFSPFLKIPSQQRKKFTRTHICIHTYTYECVCLRVRGWLACRGGSDLALGMELGQCAARLGLLVAFASLATAASLAAFL